MKTLETTTTTHNTPAADAGTADGRTVDEQRVAAFGQRLGEMLNGAAVVLMTSIGHRTATRTSAMRSPSSRRLAMAARHAPSRMTFDPPWPGSRRAV